MTLDEVVKELEAYKDEHDETKDVFMSGKVSGINRALRLLSNVDREPPAETELERRAWEYFLHTSGPDRSNPWHQAQAWINQRDRMRAANAETD